MKFLSGQINENQKERDRRTFLTAFTIFEVVKF